MDTPVKNNPILDGVIEMGLKSIAAGKAAFPEYSPQWRAFNVMERVPIKENTEKQNAMRFVTLCLVGGMADQVCAKYDKINGEKK